MNPMKLMQLRESLNRFSAAHPKVMPFLQAISREGIAENTVIEVKVTSAQGKTYLSSVRLTKEDLELFRDIKEGLS